MDTGELGSVRAALGGIVAAAAPPLERLAGRHFVAAADPGDVSGAWQAWLRAACAGDPALAPSVLSARAANGLPGAGGAATGRPEPLPPIAPDAWRAALGDVVLRDPGVLPPWGEALARLIVLGDPAGSPDPFAPHAPPLSALLAAARHAGLALLDEPLSHCPVPVADAARVALADQLAGRVAGAVLRVVEAEAELARNLGAPTVVGAEAADWLELLETYPGLAHPVGLTVARWVEATGELLDRLAGDWDRIVATFFDRDAPSRLVGVSADAGDPHLGGRSVALLAFDRGPRLAAKPKPQATAARFDALLGVLGAAGIAPPPARRRILDRGDWGWDEVVEREDCPDVDTADWFRRYGALVRVAEWCEARDLWLDNIVSRGAEPHVVDVETVLQPRLPAGVAAATSEIAAEDLLAETCVPTCLVTMPIPLRPGMPAEDLGGLTPPRSFRLPLTGAELGASADPDAEVDAGGMLRWTPPPWRPSTATDPTTWVREGYQAAEEAARRAPGALRKALESLADTSVRVILRSTFDAYRLIRGSLGPGCLADGVERHLALTPLLRAAAADPRPWALRYAWYELDSVTDLDVPFLWYRPSGRSVEAPLLGRVDDVYPVPSAERLATRLEHLDAQTDLRHEALGTAIRLASLPVEPPAAVPPPMPARPGDSLVALIAALADRLLDVAVGDPERDGLAWLGVTSDPTFGLTTLARLPDDAVEGVLGVAVALGVAARCTDNRTHAEGAVAALAGARARVAGWADGAPTDVGGWARGPAALVRTLAAVAEVLDHEELRWEAADGAAALAQGMVDGRTRWPESLGVADGATGAALALGAAGTCGVGPVQTLAFLARKYVATRVRAVPLSDLRDRLPDHPELPGVAAAAALALDRRDLLSAADPRRPGDRAVAAQLGRPFVPVEDAPRDPLARAEEWAARHAGFGRSPAGATRRAEGAGLAREILATPLPWAERFALSSRTGLPARLVALARLLDPSLPSLRTPR